VHLHYQKIFGVIPWTLVYTGEGLGRVRVAERRVRDGRGERNVQSKKS
jgi:hypothetical protein